MAFHLDSIYAVSDDGRIRVEFAKQDVPPSQRGYFCSVDSQTVRLICDERHVDWRDGFTIIIHRNGLVDSLQKRGIADAGTIVEQIPDAIRILEEYRHAGPIESSKGRFKIEVKFDTD